MAQHLKEFAPARLQQIGANETGKSAHPHPHSKGNMMKTNIKAKAFSHEAGKIDLFRGGSGRNQLDNHPDIPYCCVSSSRTAITAGSGFAAEYPESQMTLSQRPTLPENTLDAPSRDRPKLGIL